MSDDLDLRTEMLDASTVRIPESLAAELELAAGDTIQWDVTDGGRLLADVVERESDPESPPDADSESDPEPPSDTDADPESPSDTDAESDAT